MVTRSGQGQKKITKRGVGAAMLGALVSATLPASAASTYNFVVPKGVRKIRVRSYRNSKQVIDTELNVIPGQVFRIDSVQGE
jgi:hypothetical protein